MNFTFIRANWDKQTHAYHHHVWVDSRQLNKLITLVIKSDECSEKAITAQHSVLTKIFRSYPGTGTQGSLKLLMHNLSFEFGDHQVTLIEYVPGASTEIKRPYELDWCLPVKKKRTRKRAGILNNVSYMNAD